MTANAGDACPRLRRRTLAIVLGFAVLPSALILGVVSLTAARSIRSFVIESSRDAAFMVAEPLSQQIRDRADVLSDALEAPGTAAWLRELTGGREPGAPETPDSRRALLRLAGEEPILVYTPRNGVVERLTGEGYIGHGERPLPAGSGTAISAIARQWDVEMFACESRGGNGEPAYLWLCAAVTDDSVMPSETAWLLHPIDPVRIFNQLARRDPGLEGQFSLVSTHAGVLAAGGDAEELARVLEASPMMLRRAVGYDEVPGRPGVAYSHIAVPAVSELLRAGGHDGALVVLHRVEIDPAMAGLVKRVYQIAMAGIVFIVIVALFGAWLANRIVRPVIVLREGFGRLEHGDLDHRVEIRTGDEIEDLATSMNRMAETLARTYQNLGNKLLELDEKAKQLALAHEMARAINRSLDLEAIFRIVFEEIRHLVSSRFIGLGLVVKDGQAIEWAGVWTRDESEIKQGDCTPVRGTIVERCFESGRLELGAHGIPRNESGDRIALTALTLCAIPLRTNTGDVGVLLLADDSPEGFAQPELEILGRVSEYLATAVEHSRLLTNQTRFAAELERQVLERTEALREAQEQLVTAEKLAVAGEMAAHVAHEINNPLSIIKNYLRLLEGQILPLAQKLEDGAMPLEGVRIISEEIDRIARIVEQFRRIQGTRGATVRRIQLNESIGQLIQLFRQTFHQKKLEVKLELDDELGEVEVCDDYLRQILFNLLRNAYDATDVGGHISVQTRGETPGPGFFRIRVRDTGHGIPSDIAGKIFTPFFTTKTDKGSGLGLSVSYSLAKTMGGRIEARNPEGGGAEFSLILPVTPPPSVGENFSGDSPVTRRGERIIIG